MFKLSFGTLLVVAVTLENYRIEACISSLGSSSDTSSSTGTGKTQGGFGQGGQGGGQGGGSGGQGGPGGQGGMPRCGAISSEYILPTDGNSIKSSNVSLNPWAAYIFLNNAATSACLGVIINPDWIITSYSCIKDYAASPSSITVKVGSSLTAPSSAPGALTEPATTTSQVVSTVQKYTNTSAPNADIVMLKVATSLQMSSASGFMPICMPPPDACSSSATLSSFGSGYLGGWTSDASAAFGGYWVQQAVSVTVSSSNTCTYTTSPSGVVSGRTNAIGFSRSQQTPDGKTANVMAVGLFPNNAAGTEFTSICCLADFIRQNAPPPNKQ